MALVTNLAITLRAFESIAGDTGTPKVDHLIEFLQDLASGVASGCADLILADDRTVTAAAEDIDLRGTLKTALSVAFDCAKVVLIYIKNTHATSPLTIGNGTNPAFSGLFGAGTHSVIVQPGGVFLWVAPLGTTTNLAIAAGTADILKVDPGAATITYRIVVLGRSS